MSTGDKEFAVETFSVEETMSLGEFVARELPSGVLALSGELGAGKTVFVKGLARGLGIGDDIASPTFVIEQVYEGPARLKHVDAYRLGSAEELGRAGVTVEGDEGLVAVEWAEKVLAALPRERIDVSFEHTGETSRRITFGDASGTHGQFLRELRRWRGAS